VFEGLGVVKKLQLLRTAKVQGFEAVKGLQPIGILTALPD
jgi:hypothetical protein